MITRRLVTEMDLDGTLVLNVASTDLTVSEMGHALVTAPGVNQPYLLFAEGVLSNETILNPAWNRPGVLLVGKVNGNAATNIDAINAMLASPPTTLIWTAP